MIKYSVDGFSDNEVHELLHYIPPHATYASDADELDAVDIESKRVEKLKAIIAPPFNSVEENYARYKVSILICSWGYDEGLERLCDFLYDCELMEGKLSQQHRLRVYNQNYEFVLDALIGYWAINAGKGLDNEASEKVFDPICYIIDKAKNGMYEINALRTMIIFEKSEYYGPLRDYIETIIKDPETHHWKIFDGLKLVHQFDTKFVDDLLCQYRKKMTDYDLSRG